MDKPYLIEICANSAFSALAAQEGGAKRVELCTALPEGGLTPSYGEIVLAKKNLHIDLNVIIRPRSGDFLYSDLEIESMIADINLCKELGVHGVVFGMLTAQGDVDVARCQQLLEHCEGLSVTFHRAFDVCRDPMEALQCIIDLGFDRILTSGQAATAPQGSELLSQLVEQAAGRIVIMAGCGVNEDNIAQLAQSTGLREFHFSAKDTMPSQMQFRKEGVPMGGSVTIDEFAIYISSSQKIKNAINSLNSLSKYE